MRQNKTFIAIILAMTLTATGCVDLAPNYERPMSPVSGNWYPGITTPKGGDANLIKLANNIGWREFFIDEKLQEVIKLALENNRDLRIAALNVEMAQAQYRIQRADALPNINATGQGTGQKTPQDLRTPLSSEVSHQYSAGLAISAYEIDFFSRVKNLRRAALQNYLATVEARRSAQISLISSVVSAYLMLAADKEHLSLANETFKNQSANYKLVLKRFKAGISSELDVNQAKTSMETARLDMAQYTAQVAEDENALRLLIGKDVSVTLLPTQSVTAIGVMRDVPIGLNSDILLQRPDVLQAEYQLIGANANIGAARAAFFPRITLTGSAGSASTDLSRLFKGGNDQWSFTPQVSLPIFDFGRNRANLDVAKLQKDVNIAQYEKAIQTAFKEVSDALAQRNTIGDRLKAQYALVDASSKSYKLSLARFKQGLDSYLSVLDSQRNMYSTQQGLISMKLLQQNNLLTMYKVVGGGWKETENCETCQLTGKTTHKKSAD